MNQELKILLGLLLVFLGIYLLPVDSLRFQGAVLEALKLAKWYAHEHVLLCLVPAFFIAGAIGVFISRNAVMTYFGPRAPKWLSYSVASVSGTVLAVCSCTVLPLFGGIYARGAGLGPAVAFLYSGPAINVLAIVLTARILGWQLGAARAIGAILFSVVIGLLMHLIFRKEERRKAADAPPVLPDREEAPFRPLRHVALFFLSMVGILVFANWAAPQEDQGIWAVLYRSKWILTAAFTGLLGFCLRRFFGVRLRDLLLAAIPPAGLAIALPEMPTIAFAAGAAGLAVLAGRNGPEMTEWRDRSWNFAKQILPLLFMGVLAAGFFLGSPDSTNAGIIPNGWIEALVGDSPHALLSLLGRPDAAIPAWLDIVWPFWTNFFASITGALMYFATLTEVPILRGLIDSGMGRGPALALLLAGPALSLPNMLVIHTILGLKKTLTFIGLVVVMATLSGWLFGLLPFPS